MKGRVTDRENSYIMVTLYTLVAHARNISASICKETIHTNLKTICQTCFKITFRKLLEKSLRLDYVRILNGSGEKDLQSKSKISYISYIYCMILFKILVVSSATWKFNQNCTIPKDELLEISQMLKMYAAANSHTWSCACIKHVRSNWLQNHLNGTT